MTVGRAPYFLDLSMGETAAPSEARRMRRGQYSPVDKSEKIPAREIWNDRKDLMTYDFRFTSQKYTTND